MKLRLFARAASIAAALLVGSQLGSSLHQAAAAPGSEWQLAEPLLVPQEDAGTTVMQDGRVLVAGGLTSGPGLNATNAAEIYDPATGHWSLTGNLKQTLRSIHAVTLNGGKVLIAGGADGYNDAWYNSAELYDPSTGTWSYTGSMQFARPGTDLVKLHDGRALVAGGTSAGPNSDTAEVYDPATGAWTRTGNMIQPRANPADIVLDDGRVLMTGGEGPALSWSSQTEIYDPATNEWSRVGDMFGGRWDAALAVLPDHRVLMVGGYDPGTSTLYNDAEIFDPSSGQWSEAAPLHYARAGAGIATLPDGTVLVAGGNDLNGVVMDSEIYDPTTNTWTDAAPIAAAHTHNNIVQLQDGRLFMPGGYDYANIASSAAELYGPVAVAPDVSGPSDQAVGEGTSHAFNLGSFQDADGGPWTVHVDWGDGSAASTYSTSTSGSLGSLTHTYPHPTSATANYKVTETVTDSTNLTGTATFSVTVNNVAPSVGVITAPVTPIAVNTTISASANFSDPGIGFGDDHTAVWDWGDGTTSTGGITETSGSGSVAGTHNYAAPGVYTITVTVTDGDGAVGTATFQYAVVYDPTAGFVTGGGWINSPAGAYAANPSLTGTANFGFVSQYKKGASVPTGNTQFQFQAGNLNFNSTSYTVLVISGPMAQYQGYGTINGQDDAYGQPYSFILTARDGDISGGGAVDGIRVRILDSTGAVVYDNFPAADNSLTTANVQALAGGSIVIHK